MWGVLLELLPCKWASGSVQLPIWEDFPSHSVTALALPTTTASTFLPYGAPTVAKSLPEYPDQPGPSKRQTPGSSQAGGLEPAHLTPHHLATEQAVGPERGYGTVEELQRQNARHLETLEQLRRTNDSLLLELQIARAEKK